MSHRRSIIALAAITAASCAAPAISAPVLTIPESLAPLTPIDLPGGFVYRLDDSGNAVCIYDPEFRLLPINDDDMIARPSPAATPPAHSSIPAPATGAMLLLTGGAAASRRRR